MRAYEYSIQRLTNKKVYFTVDHETFGREYEFFGFIAHMDGATVAKVTDFMEIMNFTNRMDLEELASDILFAALNEPQQFYGGER